jgi:hypothetical protein
MPANKKYLSPNLLERWLKLSAGFIGGYAIVLSFFLFLSRIISPKDAVATAYLIGYIIWAVLLLVAILAKSGWKIWLIYFLVAALFAAGYFLTTP